MKINEVKNLGKLYSQLMKKEYPNLKPVRNKLIPDESHILFMCQELSKWDKKKDKAMRWLGFVQGVLCSKDYFVIEDLRKHNK